MHPLCRAKAIPLLSRRTGTTGDLAGRLFLPLVTSRRAARMPPACALPQAADSRPVPMGGENSHHTSMPVLVVDDDQAVREALRRALTMQGYSVELAADGEEALATLAANGSTVDLLILDILMPRVDGIEVAKRLRADGNEMPILMLTARD